MRVIDLALNDLLQIVRDWKAAFFLLIMPIAFTLMFGFAFGGFGSSEPADPRLPVALLDQDQSALSPHLLALLGNSAVIRFEETDDDQAGLEERVAEGELAAVVIIPAGYGGKLLSGEATPLVVISDPGSTAGLAVQGEIQTAATRLASAVQGAQMGSQVYEREAGFSSAGARQQYFDEALIQAINAWESPPIQVVTTQTGSVVVEGEEEAENAFSQSSPGMMAQFAIAGLMGAATVLVLERKSRSLQRLLTTNISRAEILLGHYLAMFIMIVVQLIVLILFGQLLLRLDYLGQPLATLSLVIATALFAAGLGLLIGTVAKTEEQVIVLALIPMFVLSGMGGAWVPLEVTPEGFRQIARLTPVAWVMTGFQDILVRGRGLEAVWPNVLVLLAYTLVLLALAVWRFRYE